MTAQLSQITITSTKVFDGFEQKLFNRHFELQVDGYGVIDIDPGMIDSNQFKKLSALLDESAIAQIVEEKKFKYQSGLFPGYVGTDDLDLKYFIRNNLLLIFSMGEYQPSRYIFHFEGAWTINKLA